MGEKTIFKNGQNYEQAVSKEEIKKTNTYIEGGSASTAIQEMQIKTMKYYFTSII